MSQWSLSREVRIACENFPANRYAASWSRRSRAQTVLERISAEPHTRLRYFCSPHHQDSALYPSIAQLERAAGFRRDDTDDSGMRVRHRCYQDLNRDVADAAGVLRAAWNMLARHGGATEARQAGVALADIAEHVQHADLNTTRKHYIVPSVETSRRVAKQRVAHRQAKKNTP